MAERCSGHCCSRFVLLFDLDQAVEVREQRAARSRRFLTAAESARLSDEDLEPELREVRFIRDMVMPLPVRSPNRFWTCRHWDATSGDCTVYDQRPSMCREHPYGGSTCEFPGCTLHAEPNVGVDWAELANGPPPPPP